MTDQDKVKEAIAVFDKSAERTTPNAQTAAWATLRAHIEGLETYVSTANRRVGEQFMEAQRLSAEVLRQQHERLAERARAEAAEARVRELEADAGRYRWLRERLAAEELTDEDVAIFALRTVGPIALRPADDDDLPSVDAAIDAAIATPERAGRE